MLQGWNYNTTLVSQGEYLAMPCCDAASKLHVLYVDYGAWTGAKLSGGFVKVYTLTNQIPHWYQPTALSK